MDSGARARAPGAGSAGARSGVARRIVARGSSGSLEGEGQPEGEDDEEGEAKENDEVGDYGDQGDDLGDSLEEWDELFVNPLRVRFTQEKIHPFFYRRGPIVNVVPKIRPILRTVEDHGDEEEVVDLVPPFNPIHCLRKGQELWTLDNRRLYAMQLAAMELWPQRCRMRVLSRSRLPRHKLKSQYRKFSTTTAGTSVSVCARYQQFDTWSWLERAVELEWCVLSQRLGRVLLAFEVLPVVGALLFRTGLTGLTSRAPLVAGFVLTFVVDLVRQRVPAIERRLCELHVQAVLNGEVAPWSPGWLRLQRAVRRVTGGEDDPDAGPMSALQVSATMAACLILLLPYILGVARARLRSSLLSVWLGIACVLVVQLGSCWSSATAAAEAAAAPLGGGGGGNGEASDDESCGGGEEADAGAGGSGAPAAEGAPAPKKLSPKGRG